MNGEENKIMKENQNQGWFSSVTKKVTSKVDGRLETIQSSNADGAQEQIESFTSKYYGYVQKASGKNMNDLS